MALTKLATNYVDYNFWVAQKFTKWLSTKPDELLDKEIPSSFSTILKTIKHIWDTEVYWYSILAEKPIANDGQKNENLSTSQIMNGWLESSKRLSDLIHSFSEKDLMKSVKIESPWFQCELPKYEYLIQVINHGTYHRGQIVTIGRNVGITDATNTDYNFYNVMK
ncbi:DinB family protein [Tenacibaculum sp. SDUM215027]|uniref:DinB family protein n=1 Tax=Tenacibaculum sp. SDUM215027 TaxID=3422596 RepID=UPI003D321D03